MLRTLLATLLLFLGTVACRAEAVTVFAAASLKTALDQVITAWQAESGHAARAAYGGTPALARQIVEGAPADLFISADQDWMDQLAQKNLIQCDSRRDLLGNTLVVIAPKDATSSFTLTDLPKLVGTGRLAIAATATVPAGKYAKAALESLRLWDALKDRLAETENVRAALMLVERGESPAGIVYGSDAAASAGVKTLATLPESSHPRIRYPVAITASSTNPNAAALLAYLSTPRASDIFASAGFIVLK